jgi:hypothetical protein
MTKTTNESDDKLARQASPGHLMAPFGWAAEPLAASLEADHSLYRALFTISEQRMHLIALALVYWANEIDVGFARLLVLGSTVAVLDRVFNRRPKGLKRALGRLPRCVLDREDYRLLIELLDDPDTAKLIYHQVLLDAQYLRFLGSIPVPMRRINVSALAEFLTRPEDFVDGLRFLAVRGAAPSFDALVTKLGTIRKPAELAAHIRKVVEQLPLPETIPPPKIEEARRLDGVAEIRQLGKRWNNCLARYLDEVNQGRAAVYSWPHAQAPAACVVERHGRLGWALREMRGPQNSILRSSRRQEIRCAFAAAGIPTWSTLEAIEDTVRKMSIQRRRPRP